MNKIKEFFRDWSIFEKVWLVFVCSLMTVIWFINGDTPFMLVLSLTGSLNLVLGAKGKVAGRYFAIINSALYAYQCLGIPLYGEVMYNDRPKNVFAHYRELEKAGLAAPQVTYIMHDLAGRGIPVRTDVTTVAEAADEILRAVGS